MANLHGRVYPFTDTYAHVSKNLRRYSASSVAEHVLAQLRRGVTEGHAALKGTPWLALLLLKWALLEPNVRLDGGDPMPLKIYEGLKQRLWDTHDAHTGGPSGNPHLMMRRIMHAQFGFQAAETKYLLLWPTLMLSTGRTSTLRAQFRGAMRMEPEDFLDLSLALFAGLKNAKGEIASNYFDALRPAYGEKIELLLGLFAKDLAGLRTALRADPAQAVRTRDELSEFPFTQRYPLVRLRSGAVGWWHPMVFARGLEMAIHERLSGLAQEYVDPFSRLFEDWVTDVAVDTALPCIREEEYKQVMGSASRAVEAVLRPGGCNVLVEAKMGLFPETVLIADNEQQVYQKLKRVRDAIAQAADVAAALQDPANPFNDSSAPISYALIITSRELNVVDGRGLQDLFPSRQISYRSVAAEGALPLGNVLIVSAQEYDRLCGVVRTGQIDLAATLREVVENNTASPTRRMFLSQHYAKNVTRLKPPLRINAAMRGAIERVTAHLGVPPEQVASKLERLSGAAVS
jgi:hypothetical protein